ncbi:hypothetical protein [uncultured Hydrogenophaga sp.]|uniref:hypothetical protein n=1 Tax=uncultured Hydrogenophaga sp. TaxID=199683 RepID=UPI00258AAE57|nr:hypothetical protein [uncultured Hydrogenophaga sp.]
MQRRPAPSRRCQWPLALTAMAVLASCGGGSPASSTASVSVPLPPPTTLVASATDMALAVAGQARSITVTNTGGAAALNLNVVTSALPAGTSLNASTCGDTLATGASCALTITPGATPTATPGDPAPAAAVLEIAGDNTPILRVNMAVLAYGSVHQGGYVFAIDDGTPYTGSIGGKVAALHDLPDQVSWSLSQLGVASGLHENATAPCHAATDGACNTALIVATDGARAPAASLCDLSTDGGFSDWYLPAACEQGYDTNPGFAAQVCGVQGSPLMDNMQSRLVDGGDLAGLSGKSYWGSTSWSISPMRSILDHRFAANPFKDAQAHYIENHVRCVRAFKP